MTPPHWLATLSKLQVLVLRANYFHGQIIQIEYESHFSALRILDISRNEFSGLLPTTYFKSFKNMMNLSDVQMLYMGDDSSLYSFSFSRENDFGIGFPINVSDVPDSVIVTMKGHIPGSFGNLTALESLDLSSNKLTREIPMQLTGLNFLEVLNLSENQLVGLIPQGKQFNTFLNDSYEGNLGLRGFPLSKRCGPDEPSEPPLVGDFQNIQKIYLFMLCT
ncbi:hypothetical protein PTKIN_Ptkin14bG0177900 [Pterospermum kingtungense]